MMIYLGFKKQPQSHRDFMRLDDNYSARLNLIRLQISKLENNGFVYVPVISKILLQ